MPTPSDLEARVINSLEKYNVDYIFQYSIGGGASVRGGILVDFIVYNPFAIPVEVQGEHWHQEELDAEDRLRAARIEEYFGRELIYLWGDELSDQEETDQTVRDKIL